MFYDLRLVNLFFLYFFFVRNETLWSRASFPMVRENRFHGLPKRNSWSAISFQLIIYLDQDLTLILVHKLALPLNQFETEKKLVLYVSSVVPIVLN